VSPKNAHTIAATSGPTPYSSRARALQPTWRRAKRGDLGVHRHHLGFQVIHPAQCGRHRLRAGRGQPDVLAALQHGPRLRIGKTPGQAGHALVEQRGVDPLRPRGVLFAQVPVQLQQHPQLPDLLGRDPRDRHPALSHQRAQMPRIGLVRLRPLLRPPLMRGLRRLSQKRGDPRALQLLHHEPPPGAALHRERHIITASEPRQPGAQRLPARRVDPAPPDLPGHSVEIVKGDLSTVDVKPSYDRHARDLLTFLY